MTGNRLGQYIGEVIVMSSRKDSSQLQAGATPKSQTEDTHNAEMTRKAAEGKIPQGPVKNQNKRGGGFSRDN
jgi:hypothetical protein